MTTATNDAFFDEYTSSNAILTYSRATAGLGISYLLDHDYKDIYLQALALLPTGVMQQGIGVLQAKRAATGKAIDAGKLAKCQTRLGTAYTKLEAKGDCETTGDATAIEAKVDAFVLDLLDELVQHAPGCPDSLPGLRRYLVALPVELVLAELFGRDGPEGVEPDVQGDKADAHSLAAQRVQQLRREVQASSRGCR